MVVTDSQIAAALRGGHFERERFDKSDMTAGEQDNVSLSASTNGVIAEIEVGADPPFADAAAAILSQFPGGDPTSPAVSSLDDAFLAGNTRGGPRIQNRLRTSGAADAQTGAKWGLGIHKAPEIPDPNAGGLHDVEDHDPNHVSNFSDIPVLYPQDLALPNGLPVAREGEFIQHIVNPGAAGSETYDFDEGTAVFKVKCLKWDGSGL